MAKISIAIIAHNEEEKLPRALASARWAYETVLVDCSSTDGTPRVAASSGARVFTRPNSTAVYVNKQYAADQCTGDWIYILDADEEITPELAAELREKADAPQGCAAFGQARKNFYFGGWLRRGGKYPDKQVRFFRRGSARFAELPVHEYLIVQGETGRLRNDLHHYHCSSSADMERKRAYYREMLVKSYQRKKKSPWKILLRPFTRFASAYFLKGGFLDGKAGLKTALMDFAIVTDSAVKYFLDSDGGAK